MICERHGHEVLIDTDLVITKVGPNRTAVMAALRAPRALSPAGVGELVRGGVPIVVGAAHGLVSTAEHLKLCGATVEAWQRWYCSVDDDLAGAVA